MNKKVKKMWIAALLSGDYKQGKNQLRDGDRFCCLGVLCNLHAQAHPEIAAMETRRGEYMGEGSWLPDEVSEWSGLDTPNGAYTSSSLSEDIETLAADNDAGYSFQRIAKIIEEKF